MKPFDLSAAKRGEPVAAKIDGTWCSDVKFVGEGFNEALIVDTPQYGTIRIRDTEHLRMIPKTRTFYINLYPASPQVRKCGDFTMWSTAEDARKAGADMVSVALAVPIEIEE